MSKPIMGKTFSLTTLWLASVMVTTLFRLVLFGLLGSLAGLAQVPAGISGTWNVTSSFGNADRQDQIGLVMILHQNGNELTGSVGPSADNQILKFSNGRVESETVSFDVGNDQAKINVQFQIQGGKAEGQFRTNNQQGVAIQGTGTGQVQSNRMTFQWSAARGDQRLQGKLELSKAEK